MALNDSKRNDDDDDAIARLLEQVHESIVAEDDTHSEVLHSDGTHVGDDLSLELTDEIESNVECLRLLERHRRRQSRTVLADIRSGDVAFVSPNVTLPQRIADFEIVRRLGEGTYGVVYLGRDSLLRRDVAIKVPRPEVLLSDDLRERFLREGKAVASLSHPNIVPVFEAGVDAGLYFLVSLYIDGISMATWLGQQTSQVAEGTAADWIAQLADAIQHAHDRGVLHRDLKPSNVLLQPRVSNRSDHGAVEVTKRTTTTASPWTIRLTDFGLARVADGQTEQTGAGAILGTPAYMSPEQASGGGEAVGEAADVYSLGAMLYELLTGRPPFRFDSLYETLRAVREKTPVRPRALRRQVSRDLEAICLRCLEKEPSKRYQSAAELRTDLARFARGEPVRARNISSAERTLRWCRKNKLTTGLVSTILALLVGLTVGSVMVAVRLANSRQQVLQHLVQEEQAHQLARQRELEARMSEAVAMLKTRSQGHRVQSLNAVSAASEAASELGLLGQHEPTLRSLAINALSQVDLETDVSWPITVSAENYLATDPECQRYVHTDETLKTAFVRDLADNRVVQQLSIPDQCMWYTGFGFGPKGKYLALRFEDDAKQKYLQVWEISSGRSVLTYRVGGFGNASGFTPDGNSIVTCASNSNSATLNNTNLNRIEVVSLQTGEVTATIPLPTTPATLKYHPTRPLLAVYRMLTMEVGCIDLVDLESRQIVYSTPWDSYVYAFDWDDSGERLATGCRDGSVRYFRVPTVDDKGHTVGRLDVTKLEAHEEMTTVVDWHPNGRMLATSSMDNRTRLWSTETGELLVTAEGAMTSFSRDGSWLGKKGGRWHVRGFDACSRLSQAESTIAVATGFHTRPHRTSQVDFWSAHPSGRLMIGVNFYHATFRDPMQSEPLAEVPLDQSGFRFSPDGQWLYAISAKHGLSRLAVEMERDEAQQSLTFSIGPPEHVADISPGTFAVSQDRVMVTPFLGTPTVFDRATHRTEQVLLPSRPMIFFGDLSPDGRYAATGRFKMRDVEIWDLQSGQRVTQLETAAASVWFSPDMRYVVAAEHGRYRFFKVGTWNQVHEFTAVSRGVMPGAIGFSRDGRFVALEDGHHIRFLEMDHLTTIASFEIDGQATIETIRISPTGQHLIVGGGDQDATYCWNLHVIQARLEQMGLHWPLDADETTSSHEATTVKLRLEVGDLTRTPTRRLHWRELAPQIPLFGNSSNTRRKVATELVDKGRYDQAIDHWTRLIEDEASATADDWYRRGHCQLHRTTRPDPAAARHDFQETLRRDEHHWGAQLELSLLSIEEGVTAAEAQQRLNALDRLVKEIERSGDASVTMAPRAALLRGLLQMEMGDYDSAIVALKSAVRASSLDLLPHALVGLAIAQQERRQPLASELSVRAAIEFMTMAQEEQSPCRRRQCEQLLARLKQRAPELEWGSVDTPIYKVARTRIDAALDAFSNADGKDSLARVLPRIQVLAKQGWFNAAAALCWAFDNEDRASTMTHYWRGYCFERLHRFGLAMEHYEQNLVDLPASTSTKTMLALVYAAGPREHRNAERALALSNEVLQHRPGDWRALLSQSIAQLCLGNDEASLKIAQQAVRNKQAPGLTHLVMATCYDRLGNREAADRSFHRAVTDQIFGDVYFGTVYQMLLKSRDIRN